MTKILRRLYRSLGKWVFPNNLRISLIRKSGVKVGKDVVINEGFTLACDIGYEGNLTIEDKVAIGPNVTIIITSNPNFSRLRMLSDIYPFIDVKGKVRIKHDAWIGAGAIILPNITIGEYSIVGAGSVVTKDVEPFTVVVGMPAKVLRRLNSQRINLSQIGK